MTVTNKSIIIEKLQSGTSEITFTKADGTLRHMTATLDVNITGVETGLSNGPKQDVFDIAIGEWRAFTWSNLRSINGEQVIL